MNRKAELNTLRNAAIVQDFLHLYTDGKQRPGAIYEQLEAKYFIDRKTIERIITKAKRPRCNAANNTASGVP